ncbi:UGT84A3, partial [Symbiodinium microadriaticum]
MNYPGDASALVGKVLDGLDDGLHTWRRSAAPRKNPPFPLGSFLKLVQRAVELLGSVQEDRVTMWWLMAVPCFVAWQAQTEAKQILVTGGVMKSRLLSKEGHHLAVVPVVEGLLERGHNVTMALPNTTEALQWFPNGIGTANLIYIGDETASLSSFKVPDMKNLRWHECILAWGKIIWNYKSLIDGPFFSVVDDFIALTKRHHFDVAFATNSFGCNAALKRSSIPWVSFLSIPPYPEIVLSDSEQICKYPNMANPRSMSELRGSLLKRVQNRVECMMLQTYIRFGLSVMNSVLQDRGFPPLADQTEFYFGAKTNIMLGGPPITLPIQLPTGLHVVGTVERKTPRELPAELEHWLDHAAAPVVYVSMGTKYEFSNSSGSNLITELRRLMSSGFRILWSLRSSQQGALQHLLPRTGEQLHIASFTPQPEVLAHPAVKAFLSHCGWGGVTDTLAAGVPVLAYPSFSEQRGNAQRLVEIGAAVLVRPDFANLVEAAEAVIQNAAFADATKDLRSLGGLRRTLDLIEDAADMRFPDPLPVQSKMNTLDAHFVRDHGVEKALYVDLIEDEALLACLLFVRRCLASFRRVLLRHNYSEAAAKALVGSPAAQGAWPRVKGEVLEAPRRGVDVRSAALLGTFL